MFEKSNTVLDQIAYAPQPSILPEQPEPPTVDNIPVVDAEFMDLEPAAVVEAPEDPFDTSEEPGEAFSW